MKSGHTYYLNLDSIQKKNGYERTVTAIPLKYIHVTNYAWPVDRIEPAKKDSPLVYFQIGLMVIILGIIVMKVYV